MGAGFDRREGFGGREHSGRGDHAGVDRHADDVLVHVRSDDQPAADVLHAPNVIGVEDRASPDQRAVAERPGDDLDAVERLRGVQRHLDDSDSALEDRFGRRLRIVGRDAADYRDQGAFGEIAAEILGSAHSINSTILRAPARKASSPSTSRHSLPAIRSAAE